MVPSPFLSALVLYGGVSYEQASRKLVGSGISDDNIANASDYVDVGLVASHLHRHVMKPTGGQWDVFIHSWVPSWQVQARLLESYQPVAARFDGHYNRVWVPGLRSAYRGRPAEWEPKQRDLVGWSPSTLMSKSSSLQRALELVAGAEISSGRRYDMVYITRPDVLLWRDIDLRLFCQDRIHHSYCGKPFNPRGVCPSDFHFILSGNLSRRLGHQLRANPLPRTGNDNEHLRRYFEMVLGARLVPDHVVINRHEEVLRKVGDSEAAYRHFGPNGCTCSPNGSTFGPALRCT